VRGPRCDPHGRCTEIEGRAGRGRFVVTHVFSIVVAEFVVQAVSPASNGAVLEHCTGVRGICRQMDRTRSELHTAGSSWSFVVADIFVVGVTEPTLIGTTPTTHVACPQNRTHVAVTSSDEHGRTAQVHRSHRGRRFIVSYGPHVRGAELPIKAPAPATHGAISK
jgi:hypothetical protein